MTLRKARELHVGDAVSAIQFSVSTIVLNVDNEACSGGQHLAVTVLDISFDEGERNALPVVTLMLLLSFGEIKRHRIYSCYDVDVLSEEVSS